MSEHPFAHLDAVGHARMVDVTAKQPTVRQATAAGSGAVLAPSRRRVAFGGRSQG